MGDIDYQGRWIPVTTLTVDLTPSQDTSAFRHRIIDMVLNGVSLRWKNQWRNVTAATVSRGQSQLVELTCELLNKRVIHGFVAVNSFQRLTGLTRHTNAAANNRSRGQRNISAGHNDRRIFTPQLQKGGNEPLSGV